MGNMNFLQRVFALGLTLLTPNLANAENEVLKHGWASVADEGTTLQSERVLKVKRLVEYVLENNKKRGIVDYNSNYFTNRYGLNVCHGDNANNCQSVLAVVLYNGVRYTIEIALYPTGVSRAPHPFGSFGGGDPFIKHRSGIKISFREDGTSGVESLSSVVDGGLDGNCDIVFVPGRLFGSSKDLYFFPETSMGIEHKTQAENICQDTLDRLIKFYEK